MQTTIPDVVVVEPAVFHDERGFFFESWNSADFAEAGLGATFVQENHSRSARGVLRGLHYQMPNSQGKLTRVVSGSAWGVAVDVTVSSPSFGKWAGVELSAANRRMMWIPPGHAHGFLALEDDTDLVYKCTSFYSPQDEQSICWDDPTLSIDWPIDGMDVRLSRRDERAKSFIEAEFYA